MKIQRGFLASTLMLISLSALGFSQSEVDDESFAPSETFLPTLSNDLSPTAGSTDEKSEGPPFYDVLTSPRIIPKVTASSEPQVEGTTQSVEPEPTEGPEVEEVTYSYPRYREGDSGPVCVKACLKAFFDVPYFKIGDNGEEEQATAIIPLPKEDKTKIGGSCGDKKNPSHLELQWGGDKYLLKLQFEKTRNGDTDNWIVTQIAFSFNTTDPTYFKDAVHAGPQRVSAPKKSEFFESPWDKSYICKSEDTITLYSVDGAKYQCYLRIQEIQIQGFMKPQTNGNFSKAEVCESDKQVKPTSNVASVAVGATLGCLILIVIIVYAVGRRMGTITDRTGYKAVD